MPASNVVPFRKPRMPPMVREAKPTHRDRRPLSANLAQLTPEFLGFILLQTENGEMSTYMDLCDRMLEMDAEIRADYETRMSAVAGSRRQIEPGHTGDPVRDRWAPDAAQFIENVVNAIPNFDQSSQDLLDGNGKGYSAVQKDWAWDSNAFVVRGLEWVHPRRFRYGREFDLRLIDDGDQINALGWELTPDLWVVHQPRTLAAYPTRAGCLRTCAWPYLFKRWCFQFWVDGAERFAWPFLWVKIPKGADEQTRNKALESGEQLSADHVAVLEEGGAFNLLETTVKDGGTWKDLVTSLNGEISKGIFGMTDLSAPGKNGAYAAVEARRGGTVLPRIALDERNLADTLKDQFCEPLIRLNPHLFGGVMAPVPSIRRIVSSARVPIATEALPAARVNEVRASQDLPPYPEPIGSMLWRDFTAGTKVPTPGLPPPRATDAGAAVADTALNGAQVTSLQEMLAAVAAGELAPDAAKIAIAASFPSFSDASVARMVDAQSARAPSDAGVTDARDRSVPQGGARGPA